MCRLSALRDLRRWQNLSSGSAAMGAYGTSKIKSTLRGGSVSVHGVNSPDPFLRELAHGLRQQRWGLSSRIQSLAATGEIIEHRAILLTASSHNCENVLHKMTPSQTLRAIAAFAPLHGVPQRTLGGIIGGLKVLHPHESPQGGLARQQLLAGGSRLRAATARPGLQLNPKGAAQPVHITPPRRAVPGAVPHPMPPGKEYSGMFQQPLAYLCSGSPAVDHRLEIPLQMCPAKLVAFQGLALVRLGPITGQHRAIALPQHLVQDLRSARGPEAENTDPARHGHPQPTPALLLPPAGFVHIGVLRLDIDVRVLYGRLYRLGDGLLHRADLPQGQRHAQHLRAEVGYPALAHPIRSAPQCHQTRQAWPIAKHGNPGRQCPTRRDATLRTRQPMQLIFGNLRSGRRHFNHLMAQRLRITPEQCLPAAPTLGRLIRNHRLHLLDGHQDTLMTGMTGLGTLLAARGLPLWPALDLRPIRGGWTRGVLRVLVEPCLQLRYFCRQSGQALFIVLYHHPQRGLDVRRDPVPQLCGQRQLSLHYTASHIRTAPFTQVWDYAGVRKRNKMLVL